jgi:4-amino-4-deoxy-L-arabinose transferase-like glycosyltransferase
MKESVTRRIIFAYLFLLVPFAWLASRFDPYQIDGDAVAYMDIADLLRAHHWAGAVNGYWHPLYPACLALAQIVLHPTRMNELGAYYTLNFVIFLAEVVAILFFVTALNRLRLKMSGANVEPLLSLNALRLLGVGLVVIASQRELSMGKVRTDALLMTLLLAAFALLQEALASESMLFAPLMGLFFGLAYLTKSFALLVALLSIAMMMAFQIWILRRKLHRVVAGGALALLVFAAVAGPYIVALSKQKHRIDFGDSGALAYAWYSSGTGKMHLEPWQTDRFGSASVHLIHPEIQLLAKPGIYSYRAEPYGTYPDWFDTTYFNERIVPHFNLRLLAKRDARNFVLVLRYLVNHPEAGILLALFILFGARFGYLQWRKESFWAPMILLGLAMWGLYGIILIEERYVTLAYLVIVLPIFAALCVPGSQTGTGKAGAEPRMRQVATAMVVLLAFLALGESLRIAADDRRIAINEGLPHAWYSKQIFGAAQGLQAIGVKPGDEIACMGTIACLNSHYFARLAGVRVLTEVYNSSSKHLLEEFEDLPNRQQVYEVVKGQGAKVMVAHFDPGAMTGRTPASSDWVRLGKTDFYAIPLNLPQPVPPEVPAHEPWSETEGPLP